MCGIVGKINFDGQPIDRDLIKRMCAASKHRGPDDEGIYIQRQIGLGHRRLSIIDLKGGEQPISNEQGSIWIVFNGEIYNYKELRKELQSRGHTFRTNSDTEVIVHLYEDYGTECLQKLNGMFAFVIWDEHRQTLFMARDRLGKKPLHYAKVRESLIFSSEIQPILEDTILDRQVNLEALDQYLSLLYVPSPHTMFQNIMKLPPAHFMVCTKGQIHIERYWQLDFAKKLYLSENEWQERILAMLEDAVQLRLVSDVPLGAFLSGGIDSSLVVALMSRLMDRPVKTFSIGFETEGEWFHELSYARLMAQRLATDHTEFIVKPQMTEVLSELVWHYGEPFGDSSSVPTYYLSKLARSEVTVAISGDGGDELFGGYSWYTRYQKLTSRKMLLTLAAQAKYGVSALFKNPDRWIARAALDNMQDGVAALLKDGRDPVKRYGRMVQYFSAGQKGRLYSKMLLQSLKGSDPFEAFRQTVGASNDLQPLDQVFQIDIQNYLPDDILVKVDIASMANSLEVRSPFLDYRLVELAAAIPADLKVNNGTSKYILKRAAGGLLPKAILERPKWGLGSPVHDWLRNDLYQITCDMLLDRRARERGFFNVDYIRQMLQAHRTEQASLGHHLWLLLNFEIWCRTFLDGTPSPITL